MFWNVSDPLPPTFAVYPIFVAHMYIANLMVGLSVLHVLAAL